MATQLEISTVAAVKSIQTLRQQTAALTGVLRELTKTLASLSGKLNMQGNSTKELAKAQKRAQGDAQRFTREMKRQEKIAASLRRRLRAAQKVTKSLGNAEVVTAVKTKGLSGSLRNLGSSAVFAVGPLSGIGARVTAFGAISSRAGVQIALMVIGVVALGVAVFKLGKAMIKTAIEVNKIMNALRVATGSVAGAEREFQFLVKTSRELALDLSTVGVQFAQLAAAAKGTRLAGEGVERIFAAVAKAALVLGLSTEQTTGAMRALQQMISKGTVQAEELRGQLGERIPGAFQLAARAMKMTTRELGKMMEQGLLVAEELFPLLADEMEKTFDPSTLSALESMTASVNSLKTEWFIFLDLLEKKAHVVEFLAGVIRGMSEELRKANDAMSGASSFNKSMKILTDESEHLTTRLSQVKSALLSVSTTALAGRGSIKTFQEAISLLEEKLADVQKRTKALQRTNDTGPSMDVFRPALTNQDFLDLPVESVDKFKVSIVGLRNVLRQLSDAAIPLEERLDLRDSLNRTASAVKAVNKVMKALDTETRLALRIQFAGEGPLPSLKQLRNIILSLIIEEKNLQNAAKDATSELRKQARATDRLQLRFDKLIVKMESSKETMEQLFSGDILGAQFEKSLGEARRLLLKFSDDVITNFARTNNIISQFQFDLFKESEGPEKAQAFADILVIVEERLAGVIQTAKDFKTLGKIFEDTRTPLEEFTVEMTKLEGLLKRYPDRVESIQRAMENLKSELLESNEVFKLLEGSLDSVRDSFIGVLKNSGSAFEVIGKLVQSLVEDLLNLIIQLDVINPILNSISGRTSPREGGSGLPTGFIGQAKEFLFGAAADEATESLKKLATSSIDSSGVLSQELVGAAVQAAVSTGVQSTAVAASTSAITLMAISAEAAAAALNSLTVSAGGERGGGILGGLFGGILGGGGGSSLIGAGSAGAAATFLPLGPSFAHGGRFIVPGGGGTDSTNVRFRATPGEEVTVRTPVQQRGEGTIVYIDARGADQAAVARLERIVIQGNATFKRRAVNAVSESRRRGNIAFGG